MLKYKGEDEEKQTPDAKIYPMVLVGTKPPQVHIVEHSIKSTAFRPPSLFWEPPWLTTKAGQPRLMPSSRSPWPRFPLSFSMKDRDLHVRPTKPSSPLHTEPEGWRLADESQDYKRLDHREYNCHSIEPTIRQQHIALSLSQKLT